MEEVNDLIEKSGYKKKWIADKMGISEVYLSYMLNGRRRLTERRKKQIVELLKIK